MKKFFSQNSEAITKFVTNQIVMSILGIMVGLAVLSAEGGDTNGISLLSGIAGAFCVGFLCFLQYDNMFFAGERDAIKAKGEGSNPKHFKGFLIALLSYAPTILVGVITVAIKLIGSEDSAAVSLIVYYAFQGSFIPFYAIQNFVGIIGYVLVCLLPSFLSAGLGFYMGSKDLPIRKALGFKIKPPYDGPVEKRRDYKSQGGSDKE